MSVPAAFPQGKSVNQPHRVLHQVVLNNTFMLLLFLSSFFNSLVLFVTSHLLVFLATSSTNVIFLYSFTISPARFNFLLIANFGIPSCWVLANILLKLFFYLDLGALQSPSTFKFHRKEDGYVPDDTQFVEDDSIVSTDKDQLNLNLLTADGSGNTSAVTKALMGSTAEECESSVMEEGASRDINVDEDDTVSKECCGYRLRLRSTMSAMFQNMNLWDAKPQFVSEKGRWIVDDEEENWN